MFSKYSVERPYTVAVAVIMIIILGVVSFGKMNTDLLPSMNLPYAIVMTTYPGASPEEVEAAVTRPMEQSMATVSNIVNISSTSRENVSMVILEFGQTANMDSVTIEMREKLDQLEGLWSDSVGNPTIMKLNPDMMPIMVAAVDVDGLTETELSDYVNQIISSELESIEGVASVSLSGELIEQTEVIIRQDKVDIMNREVKKAIHDQFKAGSDKLYQAKEDLESGKESLESGKQEMADQIAEGSQQLLDSKLQIAQGKAELDSQLRELEKQETELNTSYSTILEKEKELKKSRKELMSRRQELRTQQSELQAGIAELTRQKTQLELAKNQAYEALEKYQAAPELFEASGVTKESLEQKIADASEALNQLETSLTQEEEGLIQLDDGLDQIETGLEQTTSGEKEITASKEQIEEGRTQLAEGKKQLKEARKKIESGEASVEDALSTLQTRQILGTVEMSVASANIASGTAKIEESKQQLKDAKKTAKAQADLNTVLSTELITSILSAQNFIMPAGYITDEDVEYLVRVGDKVEDTESLKDLVILDLGMDGLDPIRLGDVADVILTDNSSEVYAKVNGQPGIMLTMQKQTGYSTGNVTDRIQEKFAQIEALDEEVHFSILMNQGVYIDIVVNSVLQNILFGGILAILILLIFMKSLRPTIVIACSIPISIVVAVVLMYFSGITLNIISLSGLALGVGMLVDNSIVVIENIFRLRGLGKSAKEAAIEGARQVAGAITASTLTTVCVFAPIVFTEGITRQLFVDMGLTIAYSLLASLLVALTLVPALSAGLLKKEKEKQYKFLDKVQGLYQGLLQKALTHKAIVLTLALVLLVGSGAAAISRGTAFMPEMESTQASLTVTMPEGSDFEEATAMSDQVVERIQDLADIETIGAMALGDTMSLMGGGESDTEISMYLLLKEDKELSSEEFEAEIAERTKDLNCEVAVSTSNMDMSTLGGSGISIQIKGKDLDQLQKIAKEVAALVEKVEGTIEVSDGLEESGSEFRIIVNKDKAMKYKMTVAQVFQLVRAEVSKAASATTISENTKDYQVYVKSDREESLTKEDLENLPIAVTNSDGEEEEIPLKKIADFEEAASARSISRDAQTRYITVSAGIDQEHNIGLVSNEVQRFLNKYEIPDGYVLEMAGEDETINEAMEQLILMLALAVVFMYLIMVAQFQSFLSPFIIMFTIPLAFTGGFLGLALTGKEVSVIAMIGFIMLSGIIVNNGIVLVDYTNQLRKDGMAKREALMEAGKTRLRPILMTAMTTILGLSTMAIGFGMGGEMIQPMAIVTIGGLIYGTLLTLLVVPCMYDILNRKKEIN